MGDKSMDKLNEILEKIQEDDAFTKEYSLTMESEFSYRYFITVKRKERSLEDRLTYNPSVAVGIDYRDTNTGFCIFFQSGYMSDVVRIRPVTYDSYVKRGDIIPVYYEDSGPVWKMGHSIPEFEHYTQTLTFYSNEVDIAAIKKYIIQTESNILNKRTYQHDCIVPSNSKNIICDCCKEKIKKRT